MPTRTPILLAPLLMASCMAFLPSATSACAKAAEAPVKVSFVESVQQDESTPAVTAVGLRKTPAVTQGEPSTPADVVVLFDTSASQTGEFRSRANEALNGLLEKARRTDRFQLTAVDVDCVPLGKGFAPAAADQTRAAILALDARTPLGSTDIIGVVDAAVELFDPSAAPRSIIYIGDGPGLNGIELADFQRVLERLRSKRISFSSIGIGPRINWACLAALANATGGMLLVPEGPVSARDAGSRLGAMAVEPVWWPEDVMLSSDVPDGRLRMLPGRLPPLRSDRDSIVLVEGPLDDGRLEMQLEGPAGANATMSAAVEIPHALPRQENSFLEELFRNARDSDGVFLPLLGREGLDLARGAVRGEAAMLAALSRQAEAAGAHESAVRLAVASLRRDPDNVDASLIQKVARRNLEDAAPAEEEPADASGALEPLPAPLPRNAEPQSRPVRDQAADSAELAEFNAMRRVRGQQLEQETAVRLRNARQLMATDPDRSRSDLKDLAEQVKRSDDLDPAMRDRLRRQIEISIRESIVRSREKAERDLAAERNRAIGRERARLNDDLRRREERIKQLTERYHALVEEGIRVGYQRPTTAFTEADRVIGEQIAEEAPDLYANHPVPMTARVIGRTAPLVARILDYDAENVRTRRAQERGFMDALHLVDVAAIPFDDEPPIVYPSAERWREITRLREKYKSVDLANPGGNEKRIYDALERPVQSFDFTETPLRDVIAQIQDAQGIPVQIDMKAFEDAGLDLETPVTKNVSGISLRSALRLLLGEIDLTYIVKDEVLLITTKDKAAENLVVKVYPVADLVMPVNPSGGLNPFQTGGGLGGAGGINSGQGGGLGGGGGMMGGGAGMGGGMFQVSDARARIGRREKPIQVPQQPGVGKPQNATPATSEDAAPAAATSTTAADAASFDDISLPADIVEAENLRSAVARYLAQPAAEPGTPSADSSEQRRREQDLAARLARLRATAAALGREERFDRAADLISAAIAAGHAEGWMYEALAVAMEAAGRPKRDVERALLSAADFSESPAELLALANCLARFGSAKQAIRMCQQVTALDPASREAYAIGMALAARNASDGSSDEDIKTLRWACAGVLSQEWPANQQEIPTRAGRLARASIEKLRQQSRAAEADAFQSAVDEALVRDIELEIAWNGDADIDLVVEEPSGTVCSISSPRSTSGGTLLGDTAASTDPSNATQRERYVAATAFPGTYRILVRRAAGTVAANTITADMTLHRGTDREQKMRRQLPLGADEILLSVDLPEGRRRESLLDAQVAQDVAVQQKLGQTILAQQLAGLADPAAAASLSQSRGTSTGQPAAGMPFFRNGAVGYQPIITTLPEGTNMFAMAVVSADRRYVRVTATPLFSGVGQVTQFNYSGAAARGTGAAGAGGAGAGGAGAGGAGGGAGGGVGGAGGAGAAGGGAVGGGVGCWVAREVYGDLNPRWLLFRHWLQTSAPRWLHDLYASRGEEFALWIHDKPWAKAGIRFLMDQVLDRMSDQATESCPVSE